MKVSRKFNLRSNCISPNVHKSKIGSSEVDFGGILKKIKEFFFIPNFVLHSNYNRNRNAVEPTESIRNFMVILGNRVTELTFDSRLHKRTYLYTHYTPYLFNRNTTTKMKRVPRYFSPVNFAQPKLFSCVHFAFGFQSFCFLCGVRPPARSLSLPRFYLSSVFLAIDSVFLFSVCECV